MDRRTAIETTVAASLAVCGCLSSESSETGTNTQSTEANRTDNETTATGPGSPDDDGTTSRETGNITISVAANKETAESFTQLELGIGRVTLSSETESSEHRVVDTIDISGEPVKVIESEQIAPGEYTRVGLTATIVGRELQSGESPYISKGSLSTAITNLRITPDSESELTVFFVVSKDGDGDYTLTAQRTRTDS